MTNNLKLSVSALALLAVAGTARAQTCTASNSSATSRTPWDQPFAATSPWNIGIGSGAQWEDPGTPAMQTLRSLSATINTSDWSLPIFVGGPSDPEVTLSTSDNEIPPVKVHVPANAHPPGGTDRNMSFFDTTQPNKVFSYWNAQFNNGHDATGGITFGLGNVFDTTGDGFSKPSYASNEVGYNYVGGVITPYDLQQGAIRHMLRLGMSPDALMMPPGATWNSNDPFPMNHTDYWGPQLYVGNVPADSTYGIPKSVDLSKLGLSPGGMMLAKAFQDYGAVEGDIAGTRAFVIFSEPSTTANPLMQQMEADVQRLMPYISIMTNQRADNINGGGTYPPPPPPMAAPGLTNAELAAANACLSSQSAAQTQVAEQGVSTTAPADTATKAEQDQVSAAMAANDTGQAVSVAPGVSTPANFNAPVAVTPSGLDGGYKPAVAVAANAGNTGIAAPATDAAPATAPSSGSAFTLASDNAVQADSTGSNTYFVTGRNNTLTATGGAEAVTVTGSGNAITTGIYNDDVTVRAVGNVIDTGPGHNTITLMATPASTSNPQSVDPTALSPSALSGTSPAVPNGTVIVLPSPGTGVDRIAGFGSTDVLDLTKALAGTGWDHQPGSVAQYVTLRPRRGRTEVLVQGRRVAAIEGTVSQSQIVGY